MALLPVAAHARAPGTDPKSYSVALEIRSSASGKLKDFYRARGYWPLWVHDGAVGKESARLLAMVASAELDGLEPKRYDLPRVEEAIEQASDGSPQALARAEIRLSQLFAAYVRDVRRAPEVQIKYLDRELEPVKQSDAAILRQAALAPSFADYVTQAGWMSPIYLRLREALAHGERWGELPDVQLPTGPILRSGAKGERVAMLRRRLGLPAGTVFDKTLATKLRAFQADHGLPTEGIAGDQTIAALNRPQAHYDDIIRLNLERARILPGPWTRHIVVDTASARLWLYQGGQERGSMKVVVGKPTEQTPMLAGMVRYAILNPYWNVPADLVQNRIAPRMLAGTAAKNFQALSDWGAGATVLDPKSIDWHAVEDGRTEVRLRQLPGGTNAMGRMKFMFPNDQGIYLHDTPERALFAKPARQFSSGCVRLEDAPRLGKWLFGKPLVPASDAPEQQVPLPEAVPVYLTYLTAVPSGAGIAFPDDVYGRDDRKARQLARR